MYKHHDYRIFSIQNLQFYKLIKIISTQNQITSSVQKCYVDLGPCCKMSNKIRLIRLLNLRLYDTGIPVFSKAVTLFHLSCVFLPKGENFFIEKNFFTEEKFYTKKYFCLPVRKSVFTLFSAMNLK